MALIEKETVSVEENAAIDARQPVQHLPCLQEPLPVLKNQLKTNLNKVEEIEIEKEVIDVEAAVIVNAAERRASMKTATKLWPAAVPVLDLEVINYIFHS